MECDRWTKEVIYIDLVKQRFLTCIGLLSLAGYLLVKLQNFPIARLLPSSTGHDTLCNKLIPSSLVNPNGFDINRISPLLFAVLNKEFDRIIWVNVIIAVTELTPSPRALPTNVNQIRHSFNTSCFVNISEYRKHY